MFRGQFAGQVIQVGGPVDAAPALGEGGRDEAIPSNSRSNFFMWFSGLGFPVQFNDYFSIPCCKPLFYIFCPPRLRSLFETENPCGLLPTGIFLQTDGLCRVTRL